MVQELAKNNEEAEQSFLFRWATFAEGQHPELRLMYHIPNEGKRSRITGAKMKQAGLRPGVPDICLPTAHGDYIGLYIEMKVKPNKPTENQKQWLRALRDAGHFTAVCYSWEEAKDLIEEYLRLPERRRRNEAE